MLAGCLLAVPTCIRRIAAGGSRIGTEWDLGNRVPREAGGGNRALDDYLDELFEYQTAQMEHRKAGVPEVGIFQVLPGSEVVSNSVCVKLRESRMGSGRLRSLNHQEMWRALRSTRQETISGDGTVRDPRSPAVKEYLRRSYDYFPRGKVEYMEETDSVRITVDRCVLEDSAALERVKEWFNLHQARVEIYANEDLFRCHRCADLG